MGTSARGDRVAALTRAQCPTHQGAIVLYSIISLLVVFWLLGFVMHIGGGLIHGLLVLAAVIFVYHLISSRSRSV
jgi:4-hydroxybenzoate polyprenyltransferase